MMRQYELVERVQKYKPHVNEALLNKAYVYAMQKHGKQTRASGDPYISHPLEVAAILTEMKMDEATIAVALLHDTIEDTSATRDEIDELFGEEIGRLVEGLTKIKKLDLVSKRAEQAENLRKLLLAISDDVRVLLVKLADRMHNMRTLEFVPAAKRARIAEETMDIYAPLAGRMGMHDIREELEDLAFRTLNSEAYETVVKKLDEVSGKKLEVIRTIEAELEQLFSEQGLNAEVKGRRKKPYSVFRKMQSKSLSFEQLSDIFGFRIVTGSTADCYRALGIVHTRWPVVPGRFKDYISTPKQNDYRSIHTTIVGPSRQRVELQIRTKDMHKVAEMGVAAHTLYKDGEYGEEARVRSRDSRAYTWLRSTIEALSEGYDPEEFLEHTKLELFHDQVFCFTPKGKLIALPQGATPIDFAYAVHTDIGDTCVGCKVNGRSMPLVTRLVNGDEVDILTSHKQVPPPAWEDVVVTGKARAAIRRATRAAVREQYAGLGQRILERTFERSGKKYSTAELVPVLHRLGQREVEDVLAAVGRGNLTAADVMRAVYPNYQESRAVKQKPTDEGWFNLRNTAGMIFRLPGLSKSTKNRRGKGKDKEQTAAMPIRGVNDDAAVHFGPGGAMPGERIVGILEAGEGITIYPIQSPMLTRFDDEPDKWIDIRWDIDENDKSRFPAKIVVSGINAPGTLAEITKVMADIDTNIQSLVMSKVAADFTDMVFELQVWDLKHFNQLIARLKALDNVSTIERLYE